MEDYTGAQKDSEERRSVCNFAVLYANGKIKIYEKKEKPPRLKQAEEQIASNE